MENNKLSITELDFDNIKSSLKQYLQSQDQFTDYNFQGSALSIVLDVLSYNTHYNAYYANMAINESFLDSAVKRASVVSRAKTLGYTPRSARSATAIVDIIVSPEDDPEYITLRRGTQIVTSNQGEQYSFFVTSSRQTFKVNGQYRFDDVVLKEGRILSYSYTVNKTKNPNLVFEIPESDVDTSLLTVRVLNSATDLNAKNFSLADGITGINSTSEVYWVQENYNGNFEIYFGDGVLGATLNDGNVVYIEYVKCSKSAPNGARYFIAGQSIGGYNSVSVITKSEAIGGTEKEDIESVRHNAPKAYAAQKRIVTANDYSVYISKNFPELEKVVVWGGEENSPPVYGKVFICAKPTTENVINDALKDIIIKDIKRFNVITVTPEFVDPDYLYIGIDNSIRVDKNSTIRSIDQMKGIVAERTKSYFETLNNFGSNFIMSRHTRMIDDSDPSIIGTSVDIRLMKSVSPLLQSYSPLDLTLHTKVVPFSVETTAFNVNIAGISTRCIMVDNGVGAINLLDYPKKNILIFNVGTIDYATGKLKTDSFLFDSIVGNDNKIFFYHKTSSPDIIVRRNQILTLDSNSSLYAINRKQGLGEVKVSFDVT